MCCGVQLWSYQPSTASAVWGRDVGSKESTAAWAGWLVDCNGGGCEVAIGEPTGSM